MNWTEEQISLLKRLLSEGKKAREIAVVLGAGVTRNAVIGKVNRMKRAARKNASAESSVGSKAAPPKTTAPKKVSPKKVVPKKPESKKPVASKAAPKSPPPRRKPARSAAAPPPPPPSPPPPPPPPPSVAESLPEPEESRESVSSSLIREPDVDEDVDEDVKGASLFGEGGCKWPIGHPGEEKCHFCGERRYRTLPYCKNHAEEAYQMADRRRGRN